MSRVSSTLVVDITFLTRCNLLSHARQCKSDPRAKKDTNYDDKMSEKEWLKAIGAEEEEYDGSSSGGEEEVQTPKKRGGGGGRGGRKKGETFVERFFPFGNT